MAGGRSYISGHYLDLSGDCLPELALLRSKGTAKWLDVWTRVVSAVVQSDHVYIFLSVCVVVQVPT